MKKNIFIIFLVLWALASFAQKKEMSLEDAVLGRYSYLNPQTLRGLSWKNENTFSYLRNDTLWIEDAGMKAAARFVSLSLLNRILKTEEGLNYFPEHSWTKDGLLMLHHKNIYTILNIEEKSTEYRIELPDSSENVNFSEEGMFFSFTINDDLFLYDINTKKTRQITNDGGNGIVNGKTVHRNEFGISKGIFNSPEGNYIAFYRMDESMVGDYPLVDYMNRMAEYRPVKYPMAGMKSHHVTTGVYNIASGKTVFLQTGEPLDHYLTNICWSPDEKYIVIAELNRDQDHLKLNYYDISSGKKINTILDEKDDEYIEPQHPVIFSKVRENEFYCLSRNDGWLHLYKYNIKGKLIKQITSGEWEISKVAGFDPVEKYVFIEANKENYLENHLYRVSIKSGKITKISNTAGIHSGLVSPDGNYIIDEFRAPDIPSQTNLISSDGNILRNIHNSPDPLDDYTLGKNQLVPLIAADGKTSLTGRIILPVDFDPAKKYPVIVYVYGGPHSQLVTKDWLNSARWWQYYMASKGFICFTMDNRGTSNRGKDFETAIFRQLGIIETKDQMKGIEFLKSLSYVDKERIGVHGWSYGGFMTLNLMLRYPETFKVAVAGGPVTDWSLYEVMYGERYMDTPQDNPEGYKKTNMTSLVPELRGKLMLIQGTQDDVVVMQHSMKFLRECIRQNKQVDFFTYPTHPHNVRGKDRIHLMEKVSNYFIENL